MGLNLKVIKEARVAETSDV